MFAPINFISYGNLVQSENELNIPTTYSSISQWSSSCQHFYFLKYVQELWFVRGKRNSPEVSMPHTVRCTVESTYDTIYNNISDIVVNSYDTVHFCTSSMVKDTAYYNAPVP